MPIYPLRRDTYISDLSALLEPDTASRLGIQAVLRLDAHTSLRWPAELQVLHLPGGTPHHLSAEELHQAVAFIAQHHTVGHTVLIQDENTNHRAAGVWLGYLIAQQGYTLPVAFLWSILRYPYLNPSPDVLRTLAHAYDLPYHEAQLRSQSFFEHLVHTAQDGINTVLPGLHISSAGARNQQADVRARGVQAVLRLDSNRTPDPDWGAEFTVLHLPFADQHLIPAGFLRQATAFIHTHATAERGVLVHCQMGISRSSTILLAYLIEYGGYSLPDAWGLLSAARPFAYPHSMPLASLITEYGLAYPLYTLESPFFLDDLLGERTRL
ncbi:MAG: dual specificity protein phosphatase family protein [Anaerolineales bacterium]